MAEAPRKKKQEKKTTTTQNGGGSTVFTEYDGKGMIWNPDEGRGTLNQTLPEGQTQTTKEQDRIAEAAKNAKEAIAKEGAKALTPEQLDTAEFGKGIKAAKAPASTPKKKAEPKTEPKRDNKPPIERLEPIEGKADVTGEYHPKAPELPPLEVKEEEIEPEVEAVPETQLPEVEKMRYPKQEMAKADTTVAATTAQKPRLAPKRETLPSDISVDWWNDEVEEENNTESDMATKTVLKNGKIVEEKVSEEEVKNPTSPGERVREEVTKKAIENAPIDPNLKPITDPNAKVNVPEEVKVKVTETKPNDVEEIVEERKAEPSPVEGETPVVEEKTIEVVRAEPKEKGQNYGLRADGTPKGKGWLGEIKLPDGKVATEYSIGINIDGEEMEIPTLVPTLTDEEIALMRDDIIPNNKEIPQSIVDKAVAHARQMRSEGKSVWKEDPETLGAEEEIEDNKSKVDTTTTSEGEKTKSDTTSTDEEDPYTKAVHDANEARAKAFDDYMLNIGEEYQRQREEMEAQDRANAEAGKWTGYAELGAGLVNLLAVGEGHATPQVYRSYSQDWMAKADRDIHEHRKRRADMADTLERLKLQKAQVEAAHSIEEMKIAKAEADKAADRAARESWGQKELDAAMLRAGFRKDPNAPGGYSYDQKLANQIYGTRRSTSTKTTSEKTPTGIPYQIVVDGEDKTIYVPREGYEDAFRKAKDAMRADIMRIAMENAPEELKKDNPEVFTDWKTFSEAVNSNGKKSIFNNWRRDKNPLADYAGIVSAIEASLDDEDSAKYVRKYYDENYRRMNETNKHLAKSATTKTEKGKSKDSEGDNWETAGGYKVVK